MSSHAPAVLSAVTRGFVLAAAAVLVGAGLSVPACGSDAVGVEACRQIETARCEAAASCGTSDSQVEVCVDFYRDQCLHGIENAKHEPSGNEVNACVAAVRSAHACAQAEVASMADCPAAPLTEGTEASISPCGVITDKAHLLAACAFVVAPDSGGSGGGGGIGGGGIGGGGGSDGGGGSGGGGGSDGGAGGR